MTMAQLNQATKLKDFMDDGLGAGPPAAPSAPLSVDEASSALAAAKAARESLLAEGAADARIEVADDAIVLARCGLERAELRARNTADGADLLAAEAMERAFAESYPAYRDMLMDFVAQWHVLLEMMEKLNRKAQEIRDKTPGGSAEAFTPWGPEHLLARECYNGFRDDVKTALAYAKVHGLDTWIPSDRRHLYSNLTAIPDGEYLKKFDRPLPEKLPII